MSVPTNAEIESDLQRGHHPLTGSKIAYRHMLAMETVASRLSDIKALLTKSGDDHAWRERVKSLQNPNTALGPPMGSSATDDL